VRRSMIVISLAAVMFLGTFASPAHATDKFIVDCSFAHRAKDDPIVYPHRPGASHMHDFFGNKSTNAFSTYRSMLHARTNCEMKGETAAYWAPTLVRGNGTIVPPRRIKVYYRTGLQAGKRTFAFPKNFRFIAGGVDTAGKRSGWNCDGTDLSPTVRIDCSGGTSGHTYVRGEVIFPMCGRMKAGRIVKDSADHRRHVVYGTHGSGCPRGHPVQLPIIKVNIRYGISNCIAAKCHLVSDMMMGAPVPGASLHADFWNTWHQRLLKKLVATKLN
jgi:hypothetical protein